MESNNELKEIDVKNCTCYYFGDIINISDFHLNNILLDEKSYEKILIYDVLYKKSNSAKPLRVIFNKVDGNIRKYNRKKYFKGRKFHREKFLHAKSSPNFRDDPLRMISKDVFTKI